MAETEDEDLAEPAPVAAVGVDDDSIRGTRDTPLPLKMAAAETPGLHRVVSDSGLPFETSTEIASVQRRVSNAAMESATGEVAPLLPLDPAPHTVEKPSVGEPPPTLEVERVTIVPTPYPDDPKAPLLVHGYISINVWSAEFRKSDANLVELIRLLRESNEIAGDTRDQLIAELTAGRVMLTAPKADRNLLEILLIIPLKYLADRAGSAVMGAVADEALHLLLQMFAQQNIPL
ncbi:MAG: hypothetical protein WAM72_20550 [Xanthobacteraceae bacterium]